MATDYRTDASPGALASRQATIEGQTDSSRPSITARLTVNETLERYPEARPALLRYGMRQGCCGGLTLAAVAERNNLNVENLLDDLRERTVVPGAVWRRGEP